MVKRTAVAIYARISRDPDGDMLGVTRQLEDCRAEAERRGWTVAEEYVDDDTSAYSGKERPEYARLTHGEVQVQTVVGLVPLRHPHIGQALTVETCAQVAEEVRHVGADPLDVVTTGTRVRRRPETVQTVRRAVATEPATGTPARFLSGPHRVSRVPLATYAEDARGIDARKHPPPSPADGYSDRYQPGLVSLVMVTGRSNYLHIRMKVERLNQRACYESGAGEQMLNRVIRRHSKSVRGHE